MSKSKEEILEYWLNMSGLSVPKSSYGYIYGMMHQLADQQTTSLQSELKAKEARIAELEEEVAGWKNLLLNYSRESGI